MNTTEITAIIAIILSLINLGITIKKEFFNPKPHLNINIKDAKFRYDGDDKTVAQIFINLSITPIVKYNGVKKIILCNSIQPCFGCPGNDIDSVNVHWYYNYYTVDLFRKKDFDGLTELMEKQRENREAIENISSNVDVPFKFTLVDQFAGIRWSDGYDDFPKEGFKLKIIDLFNQEYEIDLDFEK